MYAKAKNWNIIEIYRLAGVSGKSVMEHPEAQRMISDVQNGKISALIFSKLSRLARNTRQLLDFSDLFESNNADLISIYENIDTSSPAGKLFYTILGVMSQWEREEITSRIKASVEIRAKMGKQLGGSGQFSFKWKGKELVLDEKEAPIRKLMYELFLKEEVKTTVANTLNEMGYRTRRGAKFSRTTVKRLLRDPISKGLRRSNYSKINPVTKVTEYKPEEEWIIHECPQIVSPEVWQRVNDILDEQDSKRKPILNRKVHTFTNLVHCHCGSKMKVRSRLNHYSCENKECKNKILRTDLDDFFRNELTLFIDDDERLDEYFNQSKEGIETKQNKLENIKKNLNEVEKKLENLLHLHSINQIPSEAFSEYHAKPYRQKKQLSEQIIKIENEILEDVQKQKNTSDFKDRAKEIYSNWDNYNRKERRRIAEQIINRIIIKQDIIDIYFSHLVPNSYSSEFGENDVQNQGVLSDDIKANKEGNYPSVGIATTNIYQRNLIWEKIRERSYTDKEFAKKFALLNSNNFFVKNLENIQGDERDIIIISTTFGLNSEGKFRQNFGPINREKGYRLLNVIITRAKHQVYICTSIPRAVYSDFRTLIEEKGNTERGVFYAYLSYAETIEQENEAARENILSLLVANCKEAFKIRTSDFIASPFEKTLKKYLSKHINPDRIVLMYRYGGFIIDILIKPETNKHKPIAIECNGGQYFNKSVAYNQLTYRKKQLEGFGFKYINLWSWRFWRNPDKELENLLKLMSAV